MIPAFKYNTCLLYTSWVKVPTDSGDSFHSKINAVYQMGLFPENYPDLPKHYEGEQGAGELVGLVIQQVLSLIHI